MSGYNFLKVYLCIALTVCSFTTIFLSYNCSIDSSSPAKDATQGALSTVSATLAETFLLVAIMSAPNEKSARDLVRNTWIKLSTKGPTVVRHFFPLGTKGLDETQLEELRKENEMFGDIALIDSFEESYANLARKTLATFEYAYRTTKFSYILKVDSDSFVRISVLIKSLKDVQHPMLYWGFLDGRARPRRKGKWSEPDWMLCDRYLPYQLGGGYVLSFELASFLAKNARLFKMYKNEDVSVGAWLSGLNVKYLHDPRFDTEWTSRGCNNQYIVTHKHTPEKLQEMYNNLVNNRVLCPKEFRTRPSYVYDWSKPPSECCARINGSNIP